jgi:pyrroloquinoline-quinone synthase
MSIHADLRNQLEQAATRLDLGAHPYFAMLGEGAMSKAQFLHSQIEFAPMVQDYGRSVALLVARLPDIWQRAALLEILEDEHGGGALEHAHGNTILTLVERLGGDAGQAAVSPPSACARAFNATLRGVALSDDYRFAAAMFAAIERAFVDIAGHIFAAIVARRWLPAEQITHYGHHRDVDRAHAERFLLTVDRDWPEPTHRESIVAGLHAGVDLFSGAYAGFHANLIHAR